MEVTGVEGVESVFVNVFVALLKGAFTGEAAMTGLSSPAVVEGVEVFWIFVGTAEFVCLCTLVLGMCVDAGGVDAGGVDASGDDFCCGFLRNFLT